MATITVDQQKLVMNAFAAQFENNLVTTECVTWKQFDGEMDDRNGLTVSEQVGPRYSVTTTTSGVKDLTAGVQGSVFGSEQFTVNKTFGTSMGWADFVKIRDIGSARESVALKNAATNLSEAIDSYIFGVMQKASNNWLGTPANGVSAWADVMQGYTRLKNEGASDSDLRAVLTYDDQQALGSAVLGYAAPDGMVTDTYRKGFQGQIGGIPLLFTQQLPVLTAGTRVASGAAQVDGAAENVNYADVAVSGAAGRYMSQVISIKNLTGTKTIEAGAVFTIADVYAYDNRAQVTTTRLQQFTVIDAVTSASGIVDARIFPAIIVPGSGSGDNVLINTAHATVGTIPADSAAITFIGTASTAYRPRVLLEKQAIVVNTASLIKPATGISSSISLENVPLSVRMWQHSDFATGAHSVRFDVALTANIRDRRRIIRINGA